MESAPLDASQDTANEASNATGSHHVVIEEGGANATQAPLVFLTTGAMTHYRLSHVLISVCSQPTRMAARLGMNTVTELSEEERQTLARDRAVLARDRAALARVQQKKEDLVNIAVLQI